MARQLQAPAGSRFQKFLFLVAASVLAFVTVGLATGFIPPPTHVLADSSKIVSIYFDGQKKVITTNAGTVEQALKEANVSIGRGDLVEPGQDTAIPQGFFNVNVYRARPVAVSDKGKVVIAHTAYQNPHLIAQAAGVKTYPEDTYDVSIIHDITTEGLVGQKVVIHRATPVLIVADNVKTLVRTQQKTVGGLLDERDVALGPQDIIEPGRATAISQGMSVQVKRVKVVTDKVTQVIPRQVKTVKDPTLEVGTTQVRTEGADGSKELVYRVEYQNGVEKNRQLIKQTSISQPATKVVVSGTKPRNDAFLLLRLCESGGNYQRNSGNGYYGAYQFNLQTWQANGGSGYPHQASPADQDRIATQLQARRGWAPWPACSSRLGLR